MILGVASCAHRLLHDKVGYSTVLMLCMHAFYRMSKCLNWRNILSWIPFGSDLDPNSDNVFIFFFKGERIQISLKAGHHWPASETPLNGVSMAWRWWPNVECWLGSFENSRGSGPVLLRNSIFLCYSGGGGGGGGRDPLSPVWIRAWNRTMYTLIEITENPFYRAHRLLYDTLHTFYRMHKFLNWRNFLSWMIWIQTVFTNVNRERERERERLVHAHPFRKIKVRRQIDKKREREREREREMCVLF